MSAIVPKPIRFKIQKPSVPFIGRDLELKSIGWLHLNHRYVVILGNLNTGKSELARKYAQAYINEFSNGNVLWIPSLTMTDLIFNLEELAILLDMDTMGEKISETTIKIFNYFHHKKTLFIFDDVSEYYTLLKQLDSYINGSHLIDILITTDYSNWITDEFSVVQINHFTQDEANQYIEESLSKIHLNVDPKSCENFTKLLGFSPSILSQAVNYIKFKNKRISTYGLDEFITEFYRDRRFLLFLRHFATEEPISNDDAELWSQLVHVKSLAPIVQTLKY